MVKEKKLSQSKKPFPNPQKCWRSRAGSLFHWTQNANRLKIVKTFAQYSTVIHILSIKLYILYLLFYFNILTTQHKVDSLLACFMFSCWQFSTFLTWSFSYFIINISLYYCFTVENMHLMLWFKVILLFYYRLAECQLWVQRVNFCPQPLLPREQKKKKKML